MVSLTHIESAGSIQLLGHLTVLEKLGSTLGVGDTERLRLKVENENPTPMALRPLRPSTQPPSHFGVNH